MNDERNVVQNLAALGEQFAELVEMVNEARQPLDADRVVRCAARAIPHAAHAGLTVLGPRGHPKTWAATDDLPARIDALQHALGEGPFLRVAEGEEIARVDDVGTDPRCPTFGRQCVAQLGARSIFSVRVPVAGDKRAALSFYARKPSAFDDRDIGTAVIFAPFAGLTVQNALNARKVEQLEMALQSSRQIGTAVGILMARHLLTTEDAFARMSGTSQQLNRKLRDIAEWVERTGSLPPVPADGVVLEALADGV